MLTSSVQFSKYRCVISMVLFYLVRFEYSCVIFSFDEPIVEAMKRAALYSSSDFLAACGGILGLFLGLSAFSLIKYTVNFVLCFIWVLRKKNDVNNLVAPFHRTNKLDINTIHSADENDRKDEAPLKIKYYTY